MANNLPEAIKYMNLQIQEVQHITARISKMKSRLTTVKLQAAKYKETPGNKNSDGIANTLKSSQHLNCQRTELQNKGLLRR